MMEEHLAKKRVISFMRHKPLGEQWGHFQLSGMETMVGACSEVFVLGSGESRLEEPIPASPTGPMRGAPRKARLRGDRGGPARRGARGGVEGRRWAQRRLDRPCMAR